MSKKAKDNTSHKTLTACLSIIVLLAIMGHGLGKGVARRLHSKPADPPATAQTTAPVDEHPAEKRAHAMLGSGIYHGDDINDLLQRGLVKPSTSSKGYSPVDLKCCGYPFQFADIELEGNKVQKINYSIFVKPEQLIEEATLLLRVFGRQYGEMTWRTPDDDDRPNRFFRWDDPFTCVMMGIFPETSLLSVTVYPQK